MFSGRVWLIKDQVGIAMCHHVLVLEYLQTSNFLYGETGCVNIHLISSVTCSCTVQVVSVKGKFLILCLVSVYVNVYL